MLSESTPNSDERDPLHRAIGEVLFNVSNFPERAQARLLGQDMGPLRQKIADAVLAAGYRRQETVMAQAEAAWWLGAELGDDGNVHYTDAIEDAMTAIWEVIADSGVVPVTEEGKS